MAISIPVVAKRWAGVFLDLLYPPRCGNCGVDLEGEAKGLCSRCEDLLITLQEPTCTRCSRPMEEGLSAEQCSNCSGRDLAFDAVWCAHRYEGVLREMLHRFKYEGQWYLFPVLQQLLEEGLPGDCDGQWTVVPVPMHWRKRRRRGFNQAEMLARALARNRGWRYAEALCVQKHHSAQMEATRLERMRNVSGVFASKSRVAASLRGGVVILVDDVVTTGATAHECAQILRNQGVKKVVVICLARG